MPLPDESRRQKASDLIKKFEQLKTNEPAGLQPGRPSSSRSPSPRSPSPASIPLSAGAKSASTVPPAIAPSVPETAPLADVPAKVPDIKPIEPTTARASQPDVLAQKSSVEKAPEPVRDTARNVAAPQSKADASSVVTEEKQSATKLEAAKAPAKAEATKPPASVGADGFAPPPVAQKQEAPMKEETRSPQKVLEKKSPPKLAEKTISPMAAEKKSPAGVSRAMRPSAPIPAVAPIAARTPPKPVVAGRIPSHSATPPTKTYGSSPVPSSPRTPHFASPTRASVAHIASTSAPAGHLKKQVTPNASPAAVRPPRTTPGATPVKSASATPVKPASAASSPGVSRSSSIFDRLAATGTASSRAKSREGEGLPPSVSSTSIRSNLSSKSGTSPGRARGASTSTASPRSRVVSSASSTAIRRAAPSPARPQGGPASKKAGEPRLDSTGPASAKGSSQVNQSQQIAAAPRERTVEDPHAAPATMRMPVDESLSTVDTSGKMDGTHDAASTASSMLSPSIIEEQTKRSLAPSPPSPAIANGAPLSADGSLSDARTPSPASDVKKVPAWMKRGGGY